MDRGCTSGAVRCFVFTRMPGKSYRRRLRSLLLCLCYVFPALINSLVCGFCGGIISLLLVLITEICAKEAVPLITVFTNQSVHWLGDCVFEGISWLVLSHFIHSLQRLSSQAHSDHDLVTKPLMSLDGIKEGGKMFNWKEDDMMDRYPDLFLRLPSVR